MTISLIDLMHSIDSNYDLSMDSVNLSEFTAEKLHVDITEHMFTYVADRYHTNVLPSCDTRVHGVDIAILPRWQRDIYDKHWYGQVFRKVSDYPTDIDPETEGIKEFFECEKRNAATNAKITAVMSGAIDIPLDLFLTIRSVQKSLRSIMGEFSPTDVNVSFTSGATTDLPKGRNIVESLSNQATITPDLLAYLKLYGFGYKKQQELYSYVFKDHNFTYCKNVWKVDHTYDSENNLVTPRHHDWMPECSSLAKFFFIPKQWNKGRNGFTSPTINMAVGTAYHEFLTKRYDRFTGRKVSEAQVLHNELARVGSVKLNYATIDGKNGSDLMIRAWLLLMPASHAEFLDALRVKEYTVNGVPGKFQMLGHQGAPYTFIMETIIFHSMCYAAGFSHDEIYVFGDDIALSCQPNDPRITRYIKIAEFFGFLVNKEKSLYGESYARESCGADFVQGVSIRPHYFKSITLKNQNDVHKALNGLRDRYYDPVNRQWLDSRFKSLWFKLNQIGGSTKYFGPAEFGEQCISYPDPNYWGYTGDRRDKIFAIAPKMDGEETSLFLSLNPLSIRGNKRLRYTCLNGTIENAILHESVEGMGGPNKYADFVRTDPKRTIYREKAIGLSKFTNTDKPIDALTSLKVFHSQSQTFYGCFELLDMRVKENRALDIYEKYMARKASVRSLVEILRLRVDQLSIEIDW